MKPLPHSFQSNYNKFIAEWSGNEFGLIDELAAIGWINEFAESIQFAVISIPV